MAPGSANNTAKIPTSHTLWSPHDTIKDVSEQLGISSQLPEEVSKNLAMDVEYRIHEILEQALKFMRHGKRKTLTVQDVDRAMKALNLEPLYGYDVSRPLVFKEAMVGAGQNLYYIDDDDVDFEKLINKPLPKVPRYTSFTAHWLAIEGVQPTIPQNPNPNEIKQLPPTQRGSIENMLNLNNEDFTLTTNPATGLTTVEQSSQTTKKELEVKPLVKHMLSKELQLYFDKAIAALKDDSNESLRNATYESIRSDPGLHQLVPYFIQFIAETITHNLKSIDLLSSMLMVISSLLSNKSLFLDPYIHALMPCVLTLLLAKKIGPTQGTSEELSKHFQLRGFAAVLLGVLIEQYGSSYNTLKPRITRTLLRAFLGNTTKSSIGTQWGAITGMKYLGAEVIRIVLVGNIKSWSIAVLEPLDENDKNRKDLIEVVHECLKVLSKDGNLVNSSKKRKLNNEDSMDIDAELNEEQKKKLSDRVGKILADAIAKEEDAVNIYSGIFFGEIP